MTSKIPKAAHSELVDAKPVLTYLPKAIVERAKEIGHGNMSLGLRRAVQAYNSTHKAHAR